MEWDDQASRKAKTLIKEIAHQLIGHRSEWVALHKQSLSAGAAVANLVLESTHLDDPSWGNLEANLEVHSKLEGSLWSQVNIKRKRLTGTLSEMRTICEGVKDLRQRVSCFMEDLENQGFSDLVYGAPVFLTCPLEEFESLLSELFTMYSKELFLRNQIAQELPITRTRDTQDMYLTTWQMEPFLSKERVDEIVTIFQKETGVQK